MCPTKKTLKKKEKRNADRYGNSVNINKPPSSVLSLMHQLNYVSGSCFGVMTSKFLKINKVTIKKFASKICQNKKVNKIMVCFDQK